MSESMLIPKADLQAACDAIREKDGTTALIKSGELGPKIRAIPSGGGGGDIDALIDRSITEISSEVTSIGAHAFAECSSLTTADFPAATIIGQSAFLQCSSLTTADFPAAKSIGYNAFAECSSLTTVNFSVATRIDHRAFYGCSSLTTADFPAAKSIGGTAFEHCDNLTTVNFPAATSIGENAFYKCYNLKELRLGGSTVCQATGDPSIPVDCFILVPRALIDQYIVATNWAAYANQFIEIEDYLKGGTT